MLCTRSRSCTCNVKVKALKKKKKKHTPHIIYTSPNSSCKYTSYSAAQVNNTYIILYYISSLTVYFS